MEAWQRSELTDVTAKVAISEAFVEGRLEAPKHLARSVHGLYFEPSTKNSAENDLECLQCVYIRIRGTRSHYSVQGDGQAGRIPEGEVLSVVFSWEGGTGRPAPFHPVHLVLFAGATLGWRCVSPCGIATIAFTSRSDKAHTLHSNVLATLSFQFKGLSVSVPLCLLRSVTLVIFPTLAPVYSAIYANCGPASQAAEYQQRRWLVGEEHMVRAGFTAKLRYGIVVTIILFVVSGTSAAHCDGMDGPVVVAARTALATGDVNRVLLWVRENDEAEVKQAFQSTLKVRSLSLEAKELADRYFFETVVRLHRTAEGAPYTGLKPAGRDLGPAIPAADRALAVGSSEHLKQLLMNVLQNGLQEHFEKAFARRNFRADDLAAGRRYVEEYVEYVHYVERVYEASVKSSQGHYLEHEESQGARTHTED